MSANRLRAFRTYGTTANLRASLLEFAESGGGICTSLPGAALGRLRSISQDIEGVQAVPLDKVIARFVTLGGGPMLPLADRVQESETLAKACRELPAESPFHACRNYPGLVRRLASTLEELRQWRLRATRLNELAALADSYLRAKLESLAWLDERLASGLRSSARELETDRIERCLTLTCPSGPRQRLWIYAGAEFSPLMAAFVQWACRNGLDVWTVVDGSESATSLFGGSERLLQSLGVSARFVGGSNGLAEGLFGEQPRLDVGLDVEVTSASDPLAEVEWAFRRIRTEADKGLPLSRAAIYVRNPDDYAPLIESVSERFQMPIRMSRGQRLSQNGWIRLVSAWLDACQKNEPSGLRDVAKSTYLGLGAEVADHHLTLIALSMPDASPWANLQARISAAIPSDAWLLDAVRWHEKGALGELSFREWYDELSDLIETPWMKKAFESDSPTRQRDVAARSALLHALEQRTALAESADERIGLNGFVGEVARMLPQIEFAWPGSETGVQVASSSYALGGAEVVCVLGMIEGAFPRRRSEDPVLSDSERTAIDALRPGAASLSNSHDAARAERDELVRLCASATRHLCLFYPQVGDDRDNTPAFYLTEIRRVAAGMATDAAIPSARLVPYLEDCRFEADLALRLALDGERTFPSEPALTSDRARERVSGLPEEGLSPKELSEAIRCPFQYVIKRKLKLRAARTESKWHRLRYLPEAAGLTVAQDPQAAEIALNLALDAELDQLGPELDPSERKLLESGGRREIRGWVEREFLSRQIWRQKESNWQAGVTFGEVETAGELPIRGRTIRIRGGLAGIGDLQDFAVGQLYGGRSLGSGRSLDKIEDPDLLELGVYVWSLCKRKRNVALEVDTTTGERLLMVLPKPDSFDIESRVSQGLRVVELGQKQEFYERVKDLLGQAVDTILEGETQTRTGDHCRFCDYGDLCRRAQGFSEAFDPFELEAAAGD